MPFVENLVPQKEVSGTVESGARDVSLSNKEGSNATALMGESGVGPGVRVSGSADTEQKVNKTGLKSMTKG